MGSSLLLTGLDLGLGGTLDSLSLALDFLGHLAVHSGGLGLEETFLLYKEADYKVKNIANREGRHRTRSNNLGTESLCARHIREAQKSYLLF